MLRAASLTWFFSCVFALLCLPQAMLLAAAPKEPLPPPTLVGDTFTVNFPTEKGKPKDKLVFEEKTMSIASLGALKIPYKLTRKGNKKTSEIEFSGTITDDKGTVIEVSGRVEATDDAEVHGSITTRPKDVDPVARNFNGARTGTAKKK
jgi:hypothetical protein